MHSLLKIKFRSGFSLVEVVIAMGLATFALVSMMGLLGVGFRGARDSIDKTVIADIAQSIAGEAQLTPWDNLATNYGSANRYYDDMGNPTTSSSAVYTANISLTNATSLIEAGDHATNLLIRISSIASPQITNSSSRLLIKSE